MKRLIVLGLLLTIAALLFLNGCQEVEGALVMKPIRLTLTAPEGEIGKPTVPCDGYLCYLATNPLDLKNKPLTQLQSFVSRNKPGMPGTPDSLCTDLLFPTGRTVYFKAVGFINRYLSPTADTTRADSVLTVIYSAELSNYASRYFPPEANEKPNKINGLN